MSAVRLGGSACLLIVALTLWLTDGLRFASPILFAGNGWSEPFDVSDGKFGWFPDLTVDGQGWVHVIWGSGAQASRSRPDAPELFLDLLRYRVLREGQWSPMNDIEVTCTGGFTVRNALVAAPNGRLHALVRACTDVTSMYASTSTAWSAGAWSRRIRLGSSYYNALAVDSQGVLHALYNEAIITPNDDRPPLSEIFYRRSTDGGQTWTVRTNLAYLPGGDERPQIKVDGRDRVHVVWDHGSDWYLGLDQPGYAVYRRSDDRGESWSGHVLLGLDVAPVVQATLGLTAEGNPLVVYRSASNTTIYYQFSPDGGTSWSNSQPIPAVRARDPIERGLDSYTMATDSAGRVHLLLAGFPEDSVAAIPMLLHLSWDGQAWSLPEIVAATPNRPMWPRLVVGQGNQLHAVWFSYTDASGWGERRVWYSARTVDAPPLPPQIRSSFTPTPTPPFNPSAIPAAPTDRIVPTPTRFSDDPAPPVSGETSTPLVIAVALVPVLGLMAAIAWFARQHTR